MLSHIRSTNILKSVSGLDYLIGYLFSCGVQELKRIAISLFEVISTTRGDNSIAIRNDINGEVLCLEGYLAIYRPDAFCYKLSAVFAFVIYIDKVHVLEAFIGDGDVHRLLRLPALAIFIEDLDIIRDKVLFSGLAGIVLCALLRCRIAFDILRLQRDLQFGRNAAADRKDAVDADRTAFCRQGLVLRLYLVRGVDNGCYRLDRVSRISRFQCFYRNDRIGRFSRKGLRRVLHRLSRLLG